MSTAEAPTWRRVVVAFVRAVLGLLAVAVAFASVEDLVRPTAILLGLGIAVVWTLAGWVVLRRRQRPRGWAAARRVSFWLPELGTALRSWLAGPPTAVGLGSLVMAVASLLLRDADTRLEPAQPGNVVPPLSATVGLLVLAALLVLVASPWRAAPLAVSTVVCGVLAAVTAWMLDSRIQLEAAVLIWPQVLLCVVLLASTGLGQRILPHRSADRPPAPAT